MFFFQDVGRLLLLLPTTSISKTNSLPFWILEMCFCFFSFETIRRWRGAPRQQQIDKDTNNKQERDKRTRHIFDIKLLRCLFLRVFFFSFLSLFSLWRRSFSKAQKNQNLWGQQERRRKKWEKNQEMGRKRDDKNVDTTHTFFSFLFLSVNWLRHRPLLLSFSLSPSWFVCFPVR